MNKDALHQDGRERPGASLQTPTTTGPTSAGIRGAWDPPATAKPTPEQLAVLGVYREFARDLPPGAAHSKRYESSPGDRFTSLAPLAEVPDGTYRVAGSDWLMTFKQNRLVSAMHATPENRYGGRRVVAVPSD